MAVQTPRLQTNWTDSPQNGLEKSWRKGGHWSWDLMRHDIIRLHHHSHYVTFITCVTCLWFWILRFRYFQVLVFLPIAGNVAYFQIMWCFLAYMCVLSLKGAAHVIFMILWGCDPESVNSGQTGGPAWSLTKFYCETYEEFAVHCFTSKSERKQMCFTLFISSSVRRFNTFGQIWTNVGWCESRKWFTTMTDFVKGVWYVDTVDIDWYNPQQNFV